MRSRPGVSAAAGRAAVEVRMEVVAPSPFRLPRSHGLDGLLRVRAGVLHRLLHRDGRAVLVRVAQTGPRNVLLGAQAAHGEDAQWGIGRMRHALGVDHDLTPFLRRFRHDPLIGRAVRADPALRVRARPQPFEALTWAVCEQLIEYERAAAIQRALSWRLGLRCPVSALRDAPDASSLAAAAPAELERCGLSPSRAVALVRAAREVARGRIDLDGEEHEAGWRRLLVIPGIGRWTVQKLALEGQGRLDQLPAGDLAYVKLVGRLLTGDPYGRATETEVEEFFAPYAPWSGLAGAYALRATAGGLSRLAAA